MLSGVDKIKNILVIKPGAIGDLLHMTPVIRALKMKIPDARITMLVGSKVTASLFAGNPHLHETLVYDKRGEHRSLRGLISLWRELRSKRFDLVLNYQRSNLKGWFLASSAFPCRVLVYHKSRKQVVHAVMNHLELLAALGIDPQTADRKLDFFPSPEDRARVDNLLGSAGVLGSRIIAFNPGTNHLCKCWPLDRFSQLADLIIDQMGAEIVITGSRDEKNLAEEIQAGMRNQVHDLTGCTLGELGVILQKAELLVTGDTGPMHIAAAVGTPVLALYGPISPLRSGPVGDGHRIIIHEELECCPCNSFKCANTSFRECMEKITVEEAFENLREMLQSRLNLGTAPKY